MKRRLNRLLLVTLALLIAGSLAAQVVASAAQVKPEPFTFNSWTPAK